MSRGASGARRALVFAGGDAPPALTDVAGFAPPDERDLVVCADGGLAHCLAAGLTPHRLVGDFDSVTPEALALAVASGADRRRHPVDKDASDLELALVGLCDDGLDEVVLLGVSGGRTDHLLFNWLLPMLHDWPFRLALIDATVQARLVTPAQDLAMTANAAETVSVLPLERCEGVSTGGLAFPLDDATLLPGSTLGLSNRVADERVSVTLREGRLLVLRVR